MTNQSNDHEDDQAFFKQQMADVRPLTNKHPPIPTKPSPPPYVAPSRLEKKVLRTDTVLPENTLTPVTAAETLFFIRPGLQHKMASQLKRAKWPITATVDLHGLTQQEAQVILEKVVNQPTQDARHVIHVIHGKGYRSGSTHKPTLKNWINNWLRYQENVMAFCSAQPKDGGTGAVYVLLKRKK